MKLAKRILIFFTLIALSTHYASANMLSFSSGPFDAELDINADLTGDFSFSSPESVTGLSKFDPSLGTLTGISFDVSSGFFNYSADLFGEPLIGIDFLGEFSSNIQADLIYSTGTSGLVLEGISSSIDLSCSDVMGDGCSDNISDMFDFDSDSFDVPRPLSDFDLTDFVGNGDVTNLELSLILFGISFPESDGFDLLEVFGSADISNAIVEITYEFTPVPLPASAWLLASSLGLLGWFRKKKQA